jgi:hypothetical protein
MKPKQALIVFARFLAFLLLTRFAQAGTISINPVTVFDYPGAISTVPFSINDKNQIVGLYEFVRPQGGSRTHAFLRRSNGTFRAPIIMPGSYHQQTEAYGINNSGTICGTFTGADGAYHGFFLSGDTYTQYDAPQTTHTFLYGINDAGDFVGTEDFQGFISVGGIITSIRVPGANNTDPYQLNRRNRIAGKYDEGANISHGFYSTRTGTLKFPVDAPGAAETELSGINDRGWMVGDTRTNVGTPHGLFFIPPDQFASFDYPGANFTVLTGINHDGLICGWYGDASGNIHGLVAQVVVSP